MHSRSGARRGARPGEILSQIKWGRTGVRIVPRRRGGNPARGTPAPDRKPPGRLLPGSSGVMLIWSPIRM